MTVRDQAAAQGLPSRSRRRGAGRPRTHLPEPASLWIRYSPRVGRSFRRWPGPPQPWLDLARGGRPVWESGAEDLPRLASDPLDDTLWLPPVRPELSNRRDSLARRHLERGTPVLIQQVVGAEADAWVEPSGAPGEAVVVVDLTASLLAGDLEVLSRAAAGAVAVWPVLPGLSDGEEIQEEGCRRLAAAGVRCVQGVAPVLRPGDRRRLAEDRGEDVYHALFHGPTPDLAALARRVREAGMEPFVPRPLPRPPLQGRDSRRVAGLLALAGELWHRLERPAARGQDLYRAGREVDRSPYDLAALAREGNLGLLTWLGDAERRFVEEALEGREPRLLEELLDAWLGSAGAGRRAGSGTAGSRAESGGRSGTSSEGPSRDASPPREAS